MSEIFGPCFFGLSYEDDSLDDRFSKAWDLQKLYPFLTPALYPAPNVFVLWSLWMDRLGLDVLPPDSWVPVGVVGPLIVFGHWRGDKDVNSDCMFPSWFSGRCLIRKDYYDRILDALAENRIASRKGGFHAPERVVDWATSVALNGIQEALDYLFDHAYVADADLNVIRLAKQHGNTEGWPGGWLAAASYICNPENFPLVDVQDVSYPIELSGILKPSVVEEYKAVVFYETSSRYYVALPDPQNGSFESAFYTGIGDRELKDLCLVRTSRASVDTLVASGRKSLSNSKTLQSTYTDRDITGAFILDGAKLANFSPKMQNAGAEDCFAWVLYKALLDQAVDVHFEGAFGKGRIRFRTSSGMRVVTEFSSDMMRTIVAVGKRVAGMNIEDNRNPLDGRFTFSLDGKAYDVRASAMPLMNHPFQKLEFRLLASTVRPISDLGLETDHLKLFQKMITRPHGMILVTGPTGSGKTTTLYGALDEINSPERNIHTVEEPVEIILEGLNQHEVKDSIGVTFAKLLRMILRQDPDVILVGEIRDLESAEIAVKAAMTGHLVFATLHTNSACSAPSRLINMGIPSYLLDEVLIGIQAQRLVRKLCDGCKKPLRDPVILGKLEKLYKAAKLSDEFEAAKAAENFYQPGVCARCGETGFSGRLMVMELYPVLRKFASAIQRGITAPELQEMYFQEGYRPMFHDGLLKVSRGLTTVGQILGFSDDLLVGEYDDLL